MTHETCKSDGAQGYRTNVKVFQRVAVKKKAKESHDAVPVYRDPLIGAMELADKYRWKKTKIFLLGLNLKRRISFVAFHHLNLKLRKKERFQERSGAVEIAKYGTSVQVKPQLKPVDTSLIFRRADFFWGRRWYFLRSTVIIPINQ